MAVVVVLLLVVVALVQGEVGSKNNADVELRLCEDVCDMKRLAWNCLQCCFQSTESSLAPEVRDQCLKMPQLLQ